MQGTVLGMSSQHVCHSPPLGSLADPTSEPSLLKRDREPVWVSQGRSYETCTCLGFVPCPREDPTHGGIPAACVGTGLRIGSRIELTEGERCSFLLESFEFPREETAFLFLVRSC